MDGELVKTAAEYIASCRSEMEKRIVGQRDMIDGLLTGLIAGGHVLFEGVPGLAKTLAVKSFAQITGLQYKRIQFTPDLLPADVTGTLVWEQATGKFLVRRGPVFANVVLADEINRAPAKVHSALLEAMEERQVTIGENSYPLPEPFFVLASQNPLEHEGTYRLPEAELDRFLIKVLVPYPSPEEEVRIVHAEGAGTAEAPVLEPVLNVQAQTVLKKAAEQIFVDPQIMAYIVALVTASRPITRLSNVASLKKNDSEKNREGLYRYIAFGASPRASLSLYRCARIRALFDGRTFVNPDDVKAVAHQVLRHRIVLSYEADADSLDTDTIIARILNLVPVP
ncbi:MAG: MoxR family ATPase [Spirochaetaceae bacterium]|nr:MoxR family ATPase [Spirochaetaceae bacterium]